MLYIWPWMVPELPPQWFTSSMITEASARPRPEPPYSVGIIADSQPALVMASTNSSGKPRASSILRQYSAGNCAQRARTPSRMALSSSLYGFIRSFLDSCLSWALLAKHPENGLQSNSTSARWAMPPAFAAQSSALPGATMRPPTSNASGAISGRWPR
ncbi:hypothetical protein D3C81_1692180 [compost metagenome]